MKTECGFNRTLTAACANERSCGSARGAISDGRPYRDQQFVKFLQREEEQGCKLPGLLPLATIRQRSSEQLDRRIATWDSKQRILKPRNNLTAVKHSV